MAFVGFLLLGWRRETTNQCSFDLVPHFEENNTKSYLSTTTRRIQLTSIFFNKMEECCVVVELSWVLLRVYLLERKNMSWLFWPTYSISSFFFFSLPTYFWLTLLVTLFNFVSIKFWSINVVLFYYCYKFIFLLFGSMLVATFANHNHLYKLVSCH